NHLGFTASEPGVYRGQCAEYCGEQHARMSLHVVAEPRERFEAWLAAQANPVVAPDGPLATRGREVFGEQRCGACHTVRGLSRSAGGVAPDLTHIGSRLYLGAGTLRNHRGGLAGWIAN